MKSTIATLSVIFLLLTACDKVGSEAWCNKQEEKPKAEWTFEEMGDYTKYCALGMDPDKWCKKMDNQDKGDWTANEAADYATNCVVGRSD